MNDIPYQSTNPFWILDLPTNAPTIEVRRRLDELEMQVKLGVSTTGLGEGDLQRLRQELEDPVARFRSELRWMLWNGEGVPAVQFETVRQLQGRSDLLRRRLETATALDRALIEHDIAVLATECAATDPSQIEMIVKALVQWQGVFDSAAFLENMELHAAIRNDPRLNATFAEQCVAELRSYSLHRTLSAIQKEELSSRHRVQSALVATTLSRVTLEECSRLLFASEVDQLTAQIAELSGLLDRMSNRDDSAQLRASLDTARSLLLETVFPKLDNMRAIVPSPVPTSTIDAATEFAGQMGEMYAYTLHEFALGAALIRSAFSRATRLSLSSELNQRLAELTQAYFVQQFNRADGVGDFEGYIAALELLADHKEEPDKARFKQQAALLRYQHREVNDQAVMVRKRALLLALDPNANVAHLVVPTSPLTQPQVANRQTDAPAIAGRNQVSPPVAAVRPPLPIVSAPKKKKRRWLWFVLLLAIVAAGIWDFTREPVPDGPSPDNAVGQVTSPTPRPRESAQHTPTARFEGAAPTQVPKSHVTPTMEPGETVFIDEDFGTPRKYITGRDESSDISYVDNTLQIEVLQPGLIYFLHPVSGTSESYALSTSCTHIWGLTAGCALIWIPDGQTVGYQLNATWREGGAYATVGYFAQSGQLSQEVVSSEVFLGAGVTSVQMEVLSNAGWLVFQVNGQQIFALRSISDSPGQVGFGVFRGSTDKFGRPILNSAIASFDYLKLQSREP